MVLYKKRKAKHEGMSVLFFTEPLYFNMNTLGAIKGFDLGQTLASVICPLRFNSQAYVAIPGSPTTQDIISNSFCVTVSICLCWH